jgi:hypothetical protein
MSKTTLKKTALGVPAAEDGDGSIAMVEQSEAKTEDASKRSGT